MLLHHTHTHTCAQRVSCFLFTIHNSEGKCCQCKGRRNIVAGIFSFFENFQHSTVYHSGRRFVRHLKCIACVSACISTCICICVRECVCSIRVPESLYLCGLWNGQQAARVFLSFSQQFLELAPEKKQKLGIWQSIVCLADFLGVCVLVFSWPPIKTKWFTKRLFSFTKNAWHTFRLAYDLCHACHINNNRKMF